MAELVDAIDSKSIDGNIMRVRFSPWAPERKNYVILNIVTKTAKEPGEKHSARLPASGGNHILNFGGRKFFNHMNSKKIILIIVSLVLVAGVGFYFYGLPPIKYWTKNPTNFEECKEATRGFIIKTLPAQCEFRGQNFVDQSQ